MAKYTGRRIVPKHAGEWDIRKEYEELQIVLDADSGNSFISNLPVPKGTALSDEKYWSLFSLHSEQIAEAEEHLTQTAEDIRSELSETENRINKNVSDTEGRINESLSSTESKVNTSLSETENRVTARVENAKSDLTAKVAAAEQQMNQNAQNVAQTNKALNARMDQIAKGRTSDTEVIDARVDSEGNTFDNLGAAIRSIYPKAKEGLDALQESKVDANYDATGELTEGITVNTINGETQKFEHVQTTALIPVDTACQKVYYTGQVFNWIGVAGYDANGTFVASILDSRDTEQPQEYKEKELEIPEGVFQIRASSYAKDLSLKVCGESVKLWNQVQRERQNQKKMAIEIEALRSADDALAKEMIAREKAGKGFNFFHFMIDLTGGPCVYKRLSGCGSGTEYLAVTPWGDFYPCHQFVGEEQFLMGNVDEGITHPEIRDKFGKCNVYTKEACKDCFARFYCSGGCAANAYHFQKDISGNYGIGCELQRKRVECAIMIKAALAE